jgi:hypothetical protein
MRRLTLWVVAALLTVGVAGGTASAQKKPKAGGEDLKSKFYDFSDQLIDGEIKKPTALYTDARQKVRFDRLMRLKKSFIPAMMQTSKERVFK